MSASAEAATARWQPRSPQRRGEARRIRLLEALAQQLSRFPFGEVSIAQVADAAGLGRSAFYFYFSSKHDAVTQLMGDVFDEEIAEVSAIMNRAGDPSQNVSDGLGHIVYCWRQRGTLLLAMLDARDGDTDARLIWEDWLGHYEDFTADYITRTTEIGPAQAQLLARALIAMNERSLERHLRSGDDREAAERLHATLVHIWNATLNRTP